MIAFSLHKGEIKYYALLFLLLAHRAWCDIFPNGLYTYKGFIHTKASLSLFHVRAQNLPITSLTEGFVESKEERRRRLIPFLLL